MPVPRFLTPAKVALLALLDVYVDTRVSNAATVPVLAFLVNGIIRKSPAWQTALIPTVADFETALSTLDTVVPGRSVWDLFLDRLWSLDSFGALLEFVDAIIDLLDLTREELVEQGLSETPQQPDCWPLSRNALFGVFVRRAHLEFTRLPLHDAIQLWKEVVAWREPSFLAWKKRHPAEDATEDTTQDLLFNARLNGILYRDIAVAVQPPVASTDDRSNALHSTESVKQDRDLDPTSSTGRLEQAHLRDGDSDHIHPSGPSTESPEVLQGHDGAGRTDRSERILSQDSEMQPLRPAVASADDLERILATQVAQMQKTGLRVPQQMKESIHAMLSTNISAASLSHYSALLDASRAGDYISAFESLHRYFDYTMHIGGRSFHHYGLLNMAFLYAEFGSFAEAIAAIKECISMARENKDVPCLNFSLSWLYNLGKLHPEELGAIQQTGVLGSDREALAFIKAKAKETESWSLLSTCLLTEAELVLANGESIAWAWENITRSSYLIHIKAAHGSVGQQMALECTLRARLGLYHLEWLTSDLFLARYSPDCLAQDRVDFTCRAALRLARAGRFDDAIAQMHAIEPETLRVLKLRETWTHTMQLLRLRRALHHDDSSAIRHHLSQARAATANVDACGLAFDVALCGVDAARRRGDLPTAFASLEALGAVTHAGNGSGDVRVQLLLMVVKAELFEAAGVPLKGFTAAVRAAHAAARARCLDVLWRAVCAVARLLLYLCDWAGARDLLVAILPHVYEDEDAALTAAALRDLADAQMGLARDAAVLEAPDDASAPGVPEARPTSPASEEAANTWARRKEHLTLALGYLERAGTEFARVEDRRGQREIMAKRAIVMRVMDDHVLANDLAANYLDIGAKAKD